MKRLFFALAAAIAICANATAAEQAATAPAPMTLEQALETAIQNNPDVKIAVGEYAKSRGGVAQAQATFNPSFSANVKHTRMGPKSTIDFNGTEVDLVQEQNTQAGASVGLPLDINGQIGFAKGIAVHQKDIKYLTLMSTVQNTILNVKESYFGLLRAQGQLEVAQAAVDSSTQTLTNTQAKFDVGSVPKFDVMRAKVEVANLTQRLIATKNAVAIARSAFNKSLGIDVNAPTQVAKADINQAENVELDIVKRVEQAKANRPELRAAQKAVEIGKTSVKLQRAGFLPTLALAYSYTWDFNPGGLTGQKESWVALATLSIPIWDGGITQAKVAQAKADEQIAKSSYDSALQGVSLEVKSAALNYITAKEQVGTTAENQSLADEALRLAKVRYEAGISTLVEVTDAESALTEAKVNYVNSQYDYVIALAQLEKATSTQPEMQKLWLAFK